MNKCKQHYYLSADDSPSGNFFVTAWLTVGKSLGHIWWPLNQCNAKFGASFPFLFQTKYTMALHYFSLVIKFCTREGWSRQDEKVSIFEHTLYCTAHPVNQTVLVIVIERVKCVGKAEWRPDRNQRNRCPDHISSKQALVKLQPGIKRKMKQQQQRSSRSGSSRFTFGVTPRYWIDIDHEQSFFFSQLWIFISTSSTYLLSHQSHVGVYEDLFLLSKGVPSLTYLHRYIHNCLGMGISVVLYTPIKFSIYLYTTFSFKKWLLYQLQIGNKYL